MSAAFYIVLEREIPGFDTGVNGKALSRADKILDTLAEQAGVQPFMHFFSASPEKLAAFAEGEGIDVQDKTFPPERWFSAEDGLKTVDALLRVAESKRIEQVERIVDDLREFHKVLTVARANNVRWHLAVDF
jgi:hypothetical protein